MMESYRDMIAPMGSKVRKKWNRSKAKLEKEGFRIVPNSRFLVIANAGLGNGVRREDLDNLLGGYESLFMPPQKAYAVVSFEDEKKAQKLGSSLQGHVLESDKNLASKSVTLYVHFIHNFENLLQNSQDASDIECFPPGLFLLEDFITEEEERNLLQFLEAENPASCQLDSNLKHRQVWHYGYEFRYQYNDVDPLNPLERGIPIILEDLIAKLTKTGQIQNKPDQITINKYEPGQGIPPHIDNPSAFEDGLASLSLQSQTIMDFRHPASNRHAKVTLIPRSLLVFTGESRYQWSHGICPRKVDLIKQTDGNTSSNLTPVNRGTRYSITFRKVKADYKGPEAKNMSIPEVGCPGNELDAEVLEKAHVHQVYNQIASHFTLTRDKPWPKVKKFIEDLESHSLVFDVGCGSGRYLGVRKDVMMIGCDRSESLIQICREKGHEVFTCDGLNLSLRKSIADACICIAVIHHFSTHERRKKAVEQLLAVVREKGKILISVWALEQEFKRIKSKYLKKLDEDEVKLKDESGTEKGVAMCDVQENSEKSIGTSSTNLPVHKNRTSFQQQDVLVPWHRKSVASGKKQDKISRSSGDGEDLSQTQSKQMFHRYYHVFKEGELDSLCQSLDNVVLLDSYYDEGNWCVILEKI